MFVSSIHENLRFLNRTIRLCHSEFVQNVERISRVRIVMEKEPNTIESVDYHQLLTVTIVGDPDKFCIDVEITFRV